jgi:basic amino acid/polyamine antiporter, APA family
LENNNPEGSSSFKRTIGPYSAGALIVGTVIGTGIFLFASDIGMLMHKPSLIILVWVVGGLIALTGSFCLSELASTYPKTGGTYVFLQKAFGSFIAFEFVWANYFIIRVGFFSIQMLAFTHFAADFFSIDLNNFQKPIAISALALICGINAIGVKWGSITQNFFVVLKITSIIFIILVGFLVSVDILHRINPEITNSVAETSSRPLYISFGLALITIMWIFGGWDESPFVAEEVKNPEKNLPRSLIGGLVTCLLLYLLINISYLSILGVDEFSRSGGHTAAFALNRVFGVWAGRIISFILMISTIGAANGMILTGARIVYASGRDNSIFTWFATTNKKLKTPIRGLFVQFILGSVAILLMNDLFKLVLFTGFAYWFFYALVPLALIILRIKESEVDRPFRTPLFPVTPVVFFLASVMMIFAVINNDISNWKLSHELFSNPPTVLISLLILLSGALVFYGQRIFTRKKKDFV